ncbi:glycosyltransferase [Vibrio campbellii]|uniref:Glycosyltransferase n=1 Tax=Vibrio campbellii TaxID=680 RepID=A0AAQ3B0M0_9VIBR|nr:glycosyltransferase [Vibrio campbellii]WDG08121.1 glycosyltransferase [Vibrio campbellii]
MNKKIKVLHMGCAYYPYQGGSTQRLSALMRECSKNIDFDFYLITKTTSEDKIEDDKYFNEVIRGVNTDKIGFNKFIFNEVKRLRPDIVVTHNSRVLLNWIALYGKLFPNIKIVNEIHSFRDETNTKRLLNKYLYSRVDANIVLSRTANNYLKEKYSCKNSEIVFNGVSMNGFTKKSSKIYDKNSVTFSYIGTFHEWQGVLLLAEAIKGIEDSFLSKHTINIVGDGPHLNNFKEIVKGKNINIFGWMPKSKADQVLYDSDYILAPRLSTTGTETVVPLKVFESIDTCTPIICTPVGGLKEMFEENHAAIFTKDISADSLREIMLQPLDIGLYNDYIKKLESIKHQVPTWRNSANVYLSVFRSLIKFGK